MANSKTTIVFVSFFSVLLLASLVEAGSRPNSFQYQLGTPITCYNPGFNYQDIAAGDVSTMNSMGDDIVLKGDSDFKKDAWTLVSIDDSDLVNVTIATEELFNVTSKLPKDLQQCEEFHCADPVENKCVMCGGYQTIDSKKYQCQVWNGKASWMDTSTTLSTCGCSCYSPNINGAQQRRFLEDASSPVEETDPVMSTFSSLKRKLIGTDLKKMKDDYEDPILDILGKDTPGNRESALFITEPVETRNGFSVEFTAKVDNPWCGSTPQRFASILGLNIPFGKCYTTSSNGVSVNTCFTTATTVYSRYVKDMDFADCGGEGLAFVVKPELTPLQVTEGLGSGLGYAGLSNVLAIEFDFKTSVEARDDPTSAKYERHISLIANKGKATASETFKNDQGALAWNDSPINMGDNPTQRGAVYPVTKWKIEYKDQKFNVYWGNSLQLEWTDTKFSFRDYFGTTSSKFFVGFTASAQQKRGSTIKVGDIRLGTQKYAIDQTSSYVAPFNTGYNLKTRKECLKAPCSSIPDTLLNINSGKQFNVAYSIKDNCYDIIDIADGLNETSLTVNVSKTDCTHVQTNLNQKGVYDTEAQFIITFTCPTPGKKEFTVKTNWRDQEVDLPSIVEEVLPPSVDSVDIEFDMYMGFSTNEITMVDGSKVPEDEIGFGTVSEPAYFYTKPYYTDADGKRNFIGDFPKDLVLPSQMEPPKIQITWPDKKVYTDYIVVQRKLGLEPWSSDYKRNEYIFYAINTPVGYYKVSSSYFKNDYWFYIEAGSADRTFTQVYLTDTLPKTIEPAIFPLRPRTTDVSTGEKVSLVYDLIDESGNSSNESGEGEGEKGEGEGEKGEGEKGNSASTTVFIQKMTYVDGSWQDLGDWKDSNYKSTKELEKAYEKNGYKVKVKSGVIELEKDGVEQMWNYIVKSSGAVISIKSNAVSADVVIAGQKWSRYMGVKSGQETFANGQKMTLTRSYTRNGFRTIDFYPESAGWMFITPSVNGEEIENCEFCRQMYVQPGEIKWGKVEAWVRYTDTWFRYPMDVLGSAKIYRDKPSMVFWPRLRDNYNNYIVDWDTLGYHYDERYPNGNFIYCSEDETCKMEAILTGYGMFPMRMCWYDVDSSKVGEKYVSPCEEDVPEFKRLVFRPYYKMVIIQYTSQIDKDGNVEWKVSKRQDINTEVARRTTDDEYDTDAGNGPWKATRTYVYTWITLDNNGKKTKYQRNSHQHGSLSWGAWEDQYFVVQFRTAENRRYNRAVGSGNVMVECYIPDAKESCDVYSKWTEKAVTKRAGEVGFVYSNNKSMVSNGWQTRLQFYAKKSPLEDLYANPSKWTIEYPGRIMGDTENPWKLVWTVYVYIQPWYPSMAYIDMTTKDVSKTCPDENCLYDTKVGDRVKYQVLLFDKFGNPATLTKNANFMNIWGDYNWWGNKWAEFRPIAGEYYRIWNSRVPNTYNRYQMNMYVTKSGLYKWRSPWFTNCAKSGLYEECKEEYIQLVEAGNVAYYRSYMSLVNGKAIYQSGLTAGTNLTFRSFYRDHFYNYCPIVRYNGTDDKTISYYHTAPRATSPVVSRLQSTVLSITKAKNQKPSTAAIAPYYTEIVVNHTRAFENRLGMKVYGHVTSCAYCINMVHPATPFDMDLYQYRGRYRYYINNGTDMYRMDNRREYPQFYIEAKDIYHNIHTKWPPGFNSVAGNIVNTIDQQPIGEMINPERFGKGIIFRLKGTYYDRNSQDYSIWKNVAKGNYFFKLSLDYNYGDVKYNKDLLYPLALTGDGSDKYSQETACDQSYPSKNENLTIYAGLWSQNVVEFTLMSPQSTDNDKYAITKIMYRNPKWMVKLVREDTGEADPLLNYTTTNPSWGKLQFRFNHTVKGFYKYKVVAMIDFNQNTWGPEAWMTFNQTFQLVVRAGPIDILRFWSSDISSMAGGLFYTKTVDYTQTVNVSLYDAWNNTVEPDQVPVDLSKELNLRFSGISSWNKNPATTKAYASIGDGYWNTDVNETQFEITVHANILGWYSIKMYKLKGRTYEVRPFFYFNDDGEANLIQDLDIYYYPGYPDTSKMVQNIVVAPFQDAIPMAPLSLTKTTNIEASDMIKFIMYLRDQYGNYVRTIVGTGVESMIDRMQGLGLKVFDPRNATELNENFQVFQRFSSEGVVEDKQPMTTDSNGDEVPIPLNQVDTVCKSPICFTWTWEIFNTTTIGVFSNYMNSNVFKFVVKPGPIMVEKMDLLMRCKQMAQKTQVFTTMKASGQDDAKASETADEEANVVPVWISAENDNENFNCSTQTSPEFKIVYYDRWDNIIETQPDGVLDSQLVFGIYNESTNSVDPLLVWCKDFTMQEASRRRILRRVLAESSDYASRFKMCTDASSQSYEFIRDYGENYLPAMYWYTLSGDQNYSVGLKLWRDTTDLVKYYPMGIDPAFDDPEGSDLPMDADKSIVLPLNLTTKPLAPTPMTFDLRTSDGKRSSRWIYPTSNISIATSFEFDADFNPIYSVEYGEFPGMHELQVWSNEEYTKEDPNYITVKANGYQLAGGKIVKWINQATCKNDEGEFDTDLIGIVFYDPIERTAINTLDELNGTALPANNTDYKYVVEFMVYDENGYKCIPTQDTIKDMTSVEIVNPNGETLDVPELSINDRDQASFSFQPEVMGTYLIRINDFNATIDISFGSPSGESTVEVVYVNQVGTKNVTDEATNETTTVIEWDMNFEADTDVSVRVYPKDKYGNAIEITDAITTVFTYYFKASTDSNWKQLFHENQKAEHRFRRTRRALQISGIQLKVGDDQSYDVTFRICSKGIYTFQALLRTTAITCVECGFNIVPSEMVFANSQIWYLDATTGEYSFWMANSSLAFANTDMRPSVRLYPIDKCNNVLGDFPNIDEPLVTISDNESGVQVFTTVDVGNDAPRNYLELTTSKGEDTNDAGITEIFYQFDLIGADNLTEGQYDDLLAWEGAANGTVLFNITQDGNQKKYNGYCENDNTDGDNAPLSGNYSIWIREDDEELVKTVGEIVPLEVELRTINDLRKMDVLVDYLSYNITNKKNNDDTVSINITNSDIIGKFMVSISTTVEYFYDGPMEIELTYSDPSASPILLTGATITITWEPDVLALYTLQNSYPLKEAIVGDDYNLTFVPEDQYGNTVIIDESDPEINVYPPVTAEEVIDKELPTAIITITLDPENSNVIMTITPDRVTNFGPYEGSYDIQSKYFPEADNSNIVEYSFEAVVGPPKAENCEFTIATADLMAGTEFAGYLIARDGLGNTIPPANIDYSEFKVVYTDTAGKEHVIKATTMEVPPVTDGQPDTVKLTVLDTLVGQGTFVAYMGTTKLKCNACATTISHNTPYIPNTQILVPVGSLNVPVDKLQSPEGEMFEFNVQFFDMYNNSVTELNATETAGAYLHKNYIQWNGEENFDLYSNPYQNGQTKMSVVPDTPASTTGGRRLQEIEEDDTSREAFARSLVPSEGYEMVVTYYIDGINKGEVVLGMTITGNNLLDRGNGLVNQETTDVNATTLAIFAGESAAFEFTLKTDENKLYSNEYPDWDWKEDIELIIPEEVNYTIALISQSTFEVSLTSAVANYDRPTTISFSINGVTLNKKVFLFVNPGEPDTNTTEFMEVFPERVEMLDTVYIKLLIKDAFGNNVTDVDSLANSMSSHLDASQGKILAGPVGYGNAIFGFEYQPSYPPERFAAYIDWTDVDGNKYPLNQYPIETKVFTKLDPDSFEVNGATDLSGLLAIEGTSLYLYAKDQARSCYAGEELELTTRIVGPFISNDPKDQTLAADQAIDIRLNFTQVASNDSTCQYYYQTDVAPETLFKTGYYDIEIYMTNQTQYEEVVSRVYQLINPYLDVLTTPLKSFRLVNVMPGPIVANNSVVTLNQKGRGNGPYTMEAEQSVIFDIQTYDKFMNKYEYEDWSENLEVSNLTTTTGENANISKISVLKKTQGEYTITISITTPTGEYDNMDIKLGDDVVQFKDLQKIDGPSSIIVLPGSCSAAVPGIMSQEIEDDGVFIGERTILTIQCKDKFGNNLDRGGENFDNFIIGTNLDKVDSDQFPGTVIDNGDGTYSLIFVAPYTGDYQLFVLFNQALYGNPVLFPATVRCTSEAPTRCPETDVCETSYFECSNLDSLLNVTACTDSATPIQCMVGGEESCVANEIECDCEDGYTRCDYTSACVADHLLANICPRYIDYACDQGTVKCPDGTCRANLENCASEYVCPPGTRQCEDLSCILEEEACPSFISCADSGSTTNIYKCWDQTCVSKPEECPTQVTCLPDQVVCPDSSCKNSELECTLPSECVLESMFKCGDQSCRNSIDDCPQRTTCAKGKALCDDGTCQNDCLTQSSQSSTLRRLTGRGLQSNTTNGVADSTQVVCPGGEIESSPYLCPSVDTCPSGLLKCPDGSCKTDLSACPVVTCTNGEYMCADGTCHADPSLCATRTQCPTVTPVKCADGTCATSISSCAPILSCPPETPYKCGTSGECRRNAEECPVSTICPEGLPIKCTDGSCVKSPLHCEEASKMKSAPEGYITCPDGSFATSLIMCPSTVSCATGLYRCVDGQCVDDIDYCKSTTAFSYDVISVSSLLPYRCADGSFRASYGDCPTKKTCPLDSPILCDDGNCRQSKTQCVTNTECGFGMTKCPDGTCTNGVCSAQITCSISEPYKCYDNSCRKDPRDCPQKDCPAEEPILCADGTCQTHRLYCISPWDACSPDKPVRCPDSQCYEDSSFCKAYDECPPPFQKCYGGDCAISQQECAPVECPIQTSYKCPITGSCVTSAEFCENPSNGCEYDKSYKCDDGSCVDDYSLCPARDEIACNATTHSLCPNGACVVDEADCPNVFGCPGNEKRCGDGSCIQSNEDCPVAVCPSGTIKCNDGMCMESYADCRDSSMLDGSYCAENENGQNVPCANGQCVSSSEQCPPLFSCLSNQVRCGDGSCNVAALCPLAQTCPGDQVRCDSGACASSYTTCPNGQGCPLDTPYKCVTGNKLGLCVSNVKHCDEIVITPEDIASGFCYGETPYTCLDGTCGSTAQVCIERGYGCQEDDVVCPDGTCQESYDSCTTTNQGCPLDQPYKCADGSCKEFSTDIMGDGTGCQPEVVCPDYMPYKCQSGKCVGDPALCGTVSEEVKVDTTCPQASPIMCDYGYCVARVTDCLAVSKNCPLEKPFECVLGVCAESPTECITLGVTLGGRRLEESTVDGCPLDKPARCYDGSCLIDYSMCPIYPGCINPELPYKCGDGQCASSFFSCAEDPKCDEGTTLCVDGVCRGSCENVPFNGCPVDTPLRCGDNSCAKTLSECAGSSDCRNEKTPFRCSTGECVTDVSLCERTALSYISERFILSLQPDQTVSQSFILDHTSLVKNGKITIPSGALLSPLESLADNKTMGDTQLKISPVAFSNVVNTTNPLGTEEQAMARLIFPLTDGELAAGATVRSPIVKLESLSRNDPYEYYRFPVVLELKADDMASQQFDSASQLCLGTVIENGNSSEWACASRKIQTPYDEATGMIGFTVPKDGIYAVIFNPAPAPVDDSSWCSRSLLCTNIWYIVSISLFFLCVVAPLSYLFWRMYRYVLKYRESKKKISNIHNKYDEVMNTSTDTPFQSVKDKLEGIVFRKNPLLKQEEDENEEIKLLRKAVEKVDSDRKMLDLERKELMDKHNFYSREIGRLRGELEAANRRKTTLDANYAENMSKAQDFL